MTLSSWVFFLSSSCARTSTSLGACSPCDPASTSSASESEEAELSSSLHANAPRVSWPSPGLRSRRPRQQHRASSTASCRGGTAACRVGRAGGALEFHRIREVFFAILPRGARHVTRSELRRRPRASRHDGREELCVWTGALRGGWGDTLSNFATTVRDPSLCLGTCSRQGSAAPSAELRESSLLLGHVIP